MKKDKVMLLGASVVLTALSIGCSETSTNTNANGNTVATNEGVVTNNNGNTNTTGISSTNDENGGVRNLNSNANINK